MSGAVTEHARRLENGSKQFAGTWPKLGLVIDWQFHQARRWVSIFAPYLVQALIERLDPVIISSQEEYDHLAADLSAVVAMEPGWAAPRLRYSGAQPVAVMASDPHNKTGWFQEYVESHKVTYVLSQYQSPFFRHFPGFSRQQFVHFPWAMPDIYLHNEAVARRDADDGVVIFGAAAGDAYTLRNWCRRQPGVRSHVNSGVENKQYTDADYFAWLHQLDAVIAAGSGHQRYQLVTPKYFEIAGSGALLIGQQCPDLERLGFDQSNMLPFTRWSFRRQLRRYRRAPELFLDHRQRGRELVRTRHAVSKRVEQLTALLEVDE